VSTIEEDDGQDLTRKQRREQARARRKELEEAEAASAVRRTRLIQLGVVAGIVVAIIVAIVVATSGGSKKGPATSKHQENAVTSQVNTLIGGIPQSGNTLGSPRAPVTMQYFADLECPICRDFTDGALPTLISSYVRPGKLKIEFRSLQTATREPETFKTQQVAALAAGKQQKAWYYIELFYHEQGEENSGYVTEKYLQKLASEVPGLNLAKWASDRSDGQLANAVTTDAQAASNQGFTGTPSFLLGKTGGALHKFEYSSVTDASSFTSAIDSELKKR